MKHKNNINLSIILTSILLIFGIFSACTDNGQDAESKPAQVMTVTQIKATVGYAWFEPEFNLYHPVSNILGQINAEFQKNPCQFYIFVNPSCACTGTQKNFPHVVKILDSANIKETSYTIYSMLSYKSPHPYNTIFTLTQLPSFYIIRNQKPVYSVLDSLNYYRALNSNIDYTIEEFVLKGLKAI